MKEEQIKKIVQQSIVETSDDFVDKLMSKIEADEKMVVSPVWNLKTTLSCIIGLSLAVSFTTFKILDQSVITLSIEWAIPKTMVFSITSLTILVFINHVLKLTDEYRYLKNEI